MTDPITVAVASFAAGLAGVIGWLSIPRAPDLDPERWFKVALATLLRGQADAAGQDLAVWAEAVLREVPYHPAGRFPERKVSSPHAAAMGAAIEGERALVEKLAALPDLSSRWAWMYEGDPTGASALLDDPVDLGPAYDPSRALGPGFDWDAVAAWGGGEDKGLTSALQRQLPVTWVLVDGRPGPQPDVLGALAGIVPRSVRVPWDGPTSAALDAALTGLLDDPAARLVLVGTEAGAHTMLRALAASTALRDRTLAVISVGGVLLGVPGEDGPLGEAAVKDWMGAWFDHHKLDTEVTRRTPYLALQWLDRSADPPGAYGLPVGAARFPEARLESMTQESVLPLDLGVLPTHADPRRVAQALWLTTTCWLRAGG